MSTPALPDDLVHPWTLLLSCRKRSGGRKKSFAVAGALGAILQEPRSIDGLMAAFAEIDAALQAKAVSFDRELRCVSKDLLREVPEKGALMVVSAPKFD